MITVGFSPWLLVVAGLAGLLVVVVAGVAAALLLTGKGDGEQRREE